MEKIRSFGVATFYLGSLEGNCWWSSYWCETHILEYTRIRVWGSLQLPSEIRDRNN